MNPGLPPRLQSEKTGIRAMVAIYCRAHHGSGQKEMCRDCQEVLVYAETRLTHCPFQENKPTCGNCTVHCYKPVLRERIRRIMRFAGPRMIWRHPLMAIRHLIDSRRPAPALGAAQSTSSSSSKDRRRKQS